MVLPFFRGRFSQRLRPVCFVPFMLGLCCAGSAEEPADRVSFVNDVVPVLTKAGCNAGVCHAKAGGGQKGFQLSLLGFEPRQDFESLTQAARGRRIFLASPDHSLILRKASGQMAHGGGIRLPRPSSGYALVRRWIEEGAGYRRRGEPELVSVEVQPDQGLVQPGTELPLQALATYSDGTVRNVTHLALYESNDDAMAEVTDRGLVRTGDIPGRVAIMVRYQGRVAVFTASIPLGAPVEDLPEPRNFIDEHVFANLRQIGIPPSAQCDDATFLRRVTLDITGRLPTTEEAAEFLASSADDKRQQVIESLLASAGYADYFASKWTPLLKNRRDVASDITANFAFHAWVRDSLLANVPYDQFVRELLAATGTVISQSVGRLVQTRQRTQTTVGRRGTVVLGRAAAMCPVSPPSVRALESGRLLFAFAAFFSARWDASRRRRRGEDLIFHIDGASPPRRTSENRQGCSGRPHLVIRRRRNRSADQGSPPSHLAAIG